MKKDFENDLQNKYEEIFREINIQWRIQNKVKYEELQQQRLLNSGMASKEMYKLMECILDEAIMKLQNLFSELPIKYNRKIPIRKLQNYIDKTKEIINGTIDNMNKDIYELFKKDTLFPAETIKIFFQNIKDNALLKVDKLYQELINLRKGKKVEGLVIFNIIFTILSFGVGVASLIVGIITIGK